MVGDLIVFRQVRGRTVIQLRPNPSRKQSPWQKGNRNRFAEASLFAREAMQNPQLKEEYAKQAKRLKLPNPYTAALTLKLREWKDEIWKVKRAAQKARTLQETPESISDNDNNISVGHIECRDERITHTEINPFGPENEIEESFQNVMRQLQESVSKVDHLLSGKNQENYCPVRNVIRLRTIKPGDLIGHDTRSPLIDNKPVRFCIDADEGPFVDPASCLFDTIDQKPP